MSSRDKNMVARNLGAKTVSLFACNFLFGDKGRTSRSLTEMSNAKEQRQQTKPSLNAFPSQL